MGGLPFESVPSGPGERGDSDGDEGIDVAWLFNHLHFPIVATHEPIRPIYNIQCKKTMHGTWY